jgi:GNAT superfamily N-acetyltransferase
MGAWALAQAEAEARDAGHRSLCLRVNRRNTHAIAFYLHKGFTIDAQADYPAPNGFVYDDYLMSKIMA